MMRGGRMEFNEFSQKLKDLVKSRNTDAEVRVSKVVKINGVEKTALTILPAGAEYAPNIYLERVYGLYQSMQLSIDQAAEYVMHLHRNYLKQMEAGCLLKDEIRDFEKIRNRLTLRMVNREKNRKMLEEVVSIPCLDLEGVFYVAEDLNKMDVIMRVTRELMKSWGVEREDLEKTAMENLKTKAAFQVKDICEVICSCGFGQLPAADRGEPYLYVLTDISMRNGPAALLVPEILRKVSEELESDLLLLPSSVNELIVLRDRKTEFWRSEYQELKKVVKDINQTIVDPEEILGDSIYKFSRIQSELSVAV